VVVMIVPVGTMMMMPAVVAVVMMPPVTMTVMMVPTIVMVAMPPMVVMMMVVVTPPAPMHLLDRAGSLRNAGVHGAGHRCRGCGLGCRRKADEGQRGKWK
jgi:hypothetical protein